jgi:hypothetical protein
MGLVKNKTQDCVLFFYGVLARNPEKPGFA